MNLSSVSLRSCLYLDESTVLSCDFRKEVELNYWGGRIHGKQQLSLLCTFILEMSLWSEETAVTILSVCNQPQTKWKHRIFLSHFHSSISSGDEGSFTKEKAHFLLFSPLDYEISIFCKIYSQNFSWKLMQFLKRGIRKKVSSRTVSSFLQIRICDWQCLEADPKCGKI